MANSSQNEIELLEASIRGSTAAFESIVRKYQSFVCAITFSAIPDVEKSEDLAQETFLDAWNNLSHLRDLEKFRSWLISIARNKINDSLRKQRRDLINKASSIEEVEDKQTSKSEPDNRASVKEQQAVVQEALLHIPEKYREPLVLFYRHEKSVKHIAEQLDMSEELVKQHLSRGRKLLREQVASIVENTISKTGPTGIFTSAVMVSIIGMAVKSAGAAAAVTGSSALISGITTKVIAATAVLAIGIGTVVTYKHFEQPDKTSQMPAAASQTKDIDKSNISENTSPVSTTDMESPTIKEPAQPEIASEMNGREEISASAPDNNRSAALSEITSQTSAIKLAHKPNSSPYEYFLFTSYDQEPSTRTLVLAHVRDDSIELKDIVTEEFGTYHWGDPICVIGGKLYSKSYSTLYSIDLVTKETEQFSVRSNTLDYNFNFSNATVFADNCLYGSAQKGNTITLRQIDFERAAYRDIANVSKAQPGKDIAISPDNKRLAYFALDPNGNHPSRDEEGYYLTIIDVETGKITQPAGPIKFLIPMIASSFPGIPIIWLDSQTVAFIRTEIPEGENEFSPNTAAVHMLSRADIITGRMEDITPLPGNPYMQFAPDLIQDNAGIGPLVQLKPDNKNNYRLDLKNRKLVENDLIVGNYRTAFGQLYYKDQDLGSVESRYFKVSPDAGRIIWLSEQPVISRNAQNKEAAYRAALGPGNDLLYYHDEAQDGPVAIARVYNSAGLWLKAEDLKAQPSKTVSGAEWTPLKDISKNLPVRTYTETRKNIRDYLACTIKTDKNTYLLHEPVQVTVTLTNKSNSDIQVIKPSVYGSVMWPLTGLTLSYPEGEKRIYSGAQPYSPVDEEILLKAGDSSISSDVLEVNAVGYYSLEYNYEMNVLQQEYTGSIRTEPAAFFVSTVDDPEKEKQLFDAKFTRLMDEFHREIEMDPNWNGNNNIVSDEITGLPGMGPGAAPYLIEAIRNETHKNSRDLLLRALSSVADPEYLPYFKERLINGETESVCQWILNTYRTRGGDKDIRQQAVDALLAGMNNENVTIRKEVCRYLTKIYDESIESYFEKAIEDEDEQIKLDAGYYLAAAKWLELADWLKTAESQWSYEQYISACAVVQKLEQQWNISKGKLLILSKEDFDDAEKLQGVRQYYRKVVGDWLSWADDNPRASFQFFEEYRQTWWENDPLRQE
ncbi:MAG: sigma-70 family RNA polymerase sigma factor [Sedimentisphaerales bacterium]